MSKTKDVEVAKNQELTTAGAVNELGNIKDGGLDGSDFEIPRLSLLQAGSPDVKEDIDLEEGMYINSITKEEVSGAFVPLYAFKQYAEFKSTGELVWSTSDRTDIRVVDGLKWGESGDPEKDKPTCTEFINFMVVLVDSPTIPLVLSFKRTSIKNGKKFLTLIEMKGGINKMHEHAYTLDTIDKINGMQSWKVSKVVIPKDKAVHNLDPATIAHMAALKAKYAQYQSKVAVESDVEKDEEPPF